jgi:integrase
MARGQSRRRCTLNHRYNVEDACRAAHAPASAGGGRRTAPAQGGGQEARLFPAELGAKRAKHLHPESLSRAFARACARLGIADASTHDLRRTCLSGLIELGHEAVAERIAGHVPRHVMGRHYDRSTRAEAQRAALTAWSEAVDAAAWRVT